MTETLTSLKAYLPLPVSDALSRFPPSQIHEVRLRLKRACSVTMGKQNIILLDPNGKPIMLQESDMTFCFQKICESSIYKYENEIKNGYITLQNGCRAGFCGSRNENGMLKDISSISIRVAHYINGAADEIFPIIYSDGTIHSALIVSAPCGGKTTLLTDVAHKLSEHNVRCAVVDERGEIAASFRGVPQKNVGQLTDVLDNYPKGIGMMIALRSLSPQVLICDEIGGEEDAAAMMQALNAGVPVIASAHAQDAMQLMNRPQIKYLIDNGAVQNILFLEGSHCPGKLKYTVKAKDLYEIVRNTAGRH